MTGKTDCESTDSWFESLAKQRKVQIVSGFGEFLDQNHLCVTDAGAKKSPYILKTRLLPQVHNR